MAPRWMKYSLRAALLLPGLAAMPPAAAGEFGPPLQCTPGKDCFLQQMADMEPGTAALDPYCGPATYDGHTGLDIRLLSMADVARGVPVIAMAAGTVTGVRDGVADKLVRTQQDRAAVKDKECGNGVLVDLGNGDVTQYCHLRQGSVAVTKGQTVAKGDKLGEVGASGMAEFPHVHAELRRDTVPFDLMTGRSVREGCAANLVMVTPLLDDAFAEQLGDGDATMLAAGFAGGAVDHGALSVSGPPPPPDGKSDALTGWVWLANLRKGDRIRIRLEGPAGGVISDVTTKPMDRNKASYSAFAGKRSVPANGRHGLLIEVLRDGQVLRQRRDELVIE